MAGRHLPKEGIEVTAAVQAVAVHGVADGLQLARSVPVPECARRHAEDLGGLADGEKRTKIDGW